jgi:hypothetical protein
MCQSLEFSNAICQPTYDERDIKNRFGLFWRVWVEAFENFFSVFQRIVSDEWRGPKSADSELYERATASTDVSIEQFACVDANSDNWRAADFSIGAPRLRQHCHAGGRRRSAENTSICHCAKRIRHCWRPCARFGGRDDLAGRVGNRHDIDAWWSWSWSWWWSWSWH